MGDCEVIELSAESDAPLHPTNRAFIPRGALAAACLAGMAIGVVEWLLGETSVGLLSLAWTAAFFGVLSVAVATAAIAASRLIRSLNPLWLWLWFWLASYGIIYANILILPRQSFLTAPSFVLSLAMFASSALLARFVTGAVRKVAATLSAPRAEPGVHGLEIGLLLAALLTVVIVPFTRPRPDLSAHHSPRQAGQTNAVVILVDTLRADYLSSYGHARQTTPRIDALAAQGVRFDAAYSSSSWTVPAVASLFSGLPLSQHRTSSVQTPFEVEPTLAQELSAAGVVTAGFSSNTLVSPLYGFDRGFDTFVSYRSGLVHPAMDLCDGTTLSRLLQRGMDGDQMVVAKTKRWLREHSDDRFFLYVHLFAPHRPYAPPHEYRDLWVDPGFGGVEVQGAELGGSLQPDVLRNVLERYEAEVAYADSLVGDLLDSLKELRIEDSTAVFVTSDHGEAFGEHGNWEHGQTLYVEETRIPLVARVPGGASGRAIPDPVSLIDLHATLLEILDAGARSATRPESLAAALRGDSAVPARPVVSEILRQDDDIHPQTIQAVTLGDVRLIHNVTLGTMELFDRIADPAEIGSFQNPEVASMLEAYFAPRWWESGEGVAAHKVALTEDDIKRLQSLGYIR